MAVRTTKEIFDEFFADKDPVTVSKTRSQVDRPEVYLYEEKIGKELLDMNGDELFEMICTFNNSKSQSSEEIKITPTTFQKVVSSYRNIFQMYIEKYNPIMNPFHTAKFKGMRANMGLSSAKERFTFAHVEKAIDMLHKMYDKDRADYYELMIRLFYEGFAEAQEIVLLKEEDINFRRNEVRLPGRSIRLSNQCMSLLISVHKMEHMDGGRKESDMVSWHGSYIKFSVRSGEGDNFQNTSLADVGRKINTILSTSVSRECKIDLKYRKLYLLGFYDFMVKKYGEERTANIIKSLRVPEDIDDLLTAKNEYGLVINNSTYLKQSLVQFI